ncbi:flagellar protein FlaG [Lachnospiraceae bacterium 45-W7]
MAIEALKSAGIAAYQGSSPKPTVSVAEPPVKPEVLSAGVKARGPEMVVDMADVMSRKRNTEAAAGNGKAQKNTAKAAADVEPVFPESKETLEGAASAEGLKRAVEEINKKVVNSEAVFGVHDSTNRVTIKIVDKQTKEVLKEYPPEKTLDMIAKVWELAGLLVDEKG